MNTNRSEVMAGRGRFWGNLSMGLLLGLSLGIASCGGGGGGGGPPSTDPPVTPPTDPPVTPPVDPDPPVTPVPTALEQVKDRFAFGSKLKVGVIDEPQMLVLVALADAQLKAGTHGNGPSLRQAYEEAVASSKVYEAKTAGGGFTALNIMFSEMSPRMTTMAARTGLLRGYRSMFHQLSRPALLPTTTRVEIELASNRELGWVAIQGSVVDSLIDEVQELCDGSESAQGYCDDLFQPSIGVSAKDSYVDICAENLAHIPACELLGDDDATRVLAKSASTEVEKAQEAADECVNWTDACQKLSDADRQRRAEQLISKLSWASRLEKYLGFPEKEQVERAKVVAAGFGTVYVAAGRIWDSYQALPAGTLDTLTQSGWGDYANLIFRKESVPELAGAVQHAVSLISAVFSTVNAIKGVLALFDGVNIGGASGQDEQLLLAIASLSKKIDQLAESQAISFSKLDSRMLSLIHSTTVGLNAISDKLMSTTARSNELALALGAIREQLSSATLILNESLTDLNRIPLTQLSGLASQISREDYNDQIGKLALYLSSSPSNRVLSGPSEDLAAVTAPKVLFAAPVGNITRPLRDYPSYRFGLPRLSTADVDNAAELYAGSRLYFEFIERYPDYSVQASAAHIEHLSMIIEHVDVHTAAEKAVNEDPWGLLAAMIDDYIEAGDLFQRTINATQNDYLTLRSPVDAAYAKVDIYKGVDQVIDYTPRVFASGESILACTGWPGAPMPMPLPGALIDFDPLVRLVEALGVGPGTVQVCAYTNGSPTRGGWLNYSEDGTHSWGVIRPRVTVSIGDIGVRSLQVSLPFEDAAAPKSICVGSMQAWERLRADQVVAQAWQGTFRPDSACGDLGARPSRVKSLLESGGFNEVYNWNTRDPLTRKGLADAAMTRMEGLRMDFLDYVVAEVPGTAAIGLAAAEFDGRRLALEKMLQFGMPASFSSNSALSALMRGDQALPNSQRVMKIYQDARDAKQQERVDFVPEVEAKAQTLKTLLTGITARNRSGASIELNPDLAALKTEAQLQRSALQSSR